MAAEIKSNDNLLVSVILLRYVRSPVVRYYSRPSFYTRGYKILGRRGKFHSAQVAALSLTYLHQPCALFKLRAARKKTRLPAAPAPRWLVVRPPPGVAGCAGCWRRSGRSAVGVVGWAEAAEAAEAGVDSCLLRGIFHLTARRGRSGGPGPWPGHCESRRLTVPPPDLAVLAVLAGLAGRPRKAARCYRGLKQFVCVRAQQVSKYPRLAAIGGVGVVGATDSPSSSTLRYPTIRYLPCCKHHS